MFWDYFDKTQPKPPEELERKQTEVANDFFATRTIPGITSEQRARLQGSITNKVARMNYPPEAFTERALFLRYVTDRRAEYEKLLLQSKSSDDVFIRNFLGQLSIDSNYITAPLSEDEMRELTNWKIAYLKRLSADGTKSAYVAAYLKAWNLSPDLLNGAN